MEALLEKLGRDRWLTTEEYARLIRERPPRLGLLADRTRRRHRGPGVYLRGILDVSSICQHDCPHCPQRCSADPAIRCRLRPREILELCEEALSLDIRSIVLRCGTDRFYSDEMLCGILEKLRRSCPELSVTLAMGERSRRSYERLYNAGAEGYLLLEETVDRERYERIHGETLSFDRRLHCLGQLPDVGFRTGCGFLTGLPGQTAEDLARELKFLEEFQPQAVELVPLTAQPELTDCLLSIIRLILPGAAVTAPGNSPRCIPAGADVVSVRLAGGGTHPLCGGNFAPAAGDIESLAALRRELSEAGFEVAMEPPRWNG